jgi:hypothetical protein
MSWVTHYFDRRLNTNAISRAHATKEGALRNACDLTLQKCIVKYVQGPDNHRIGPVEIQAWCKHTKLLIGRSTPNHEAVPWLRRKAGGVGGGRPSLPIMILLDSVSVKAQPSN